MPHVAIQKVHLDPAAAAPVAEEFGPLAEQIRQLAFQLFERRGGGDGHALEDWLDAERELVLTPASELIATDGRYEARVAAPGFEARDVQVTAWPTALMVKAESSHHHEQGDAEVRLCEFGHKTLFRKLELPEPIDVDTVTAKLSNGILHVSATRRDRAEEQGAQ